MSTGAGAPCEGIVSTVLVHRQAPQEGLGTGSTGAPQEGIVTSEYRDTTGGKSEYRGTAGGQSEYRGTTGGQREYRGTTTSLVSLTILCIPLSIIKLLVL